MIDLGIFLFPKQSWNTKSLWSSVFGGFGKSAHLKVRHLYLTLDNCSAHTLYYSPFQQVSDVFFHPGITSYLQLVDASIGRSFKFIYRSLLLQHILLEKDMIKPPRERHPFKLNEIVTTYDAVVMMAKS